MKPSRKDKKKKFHNNNNQDKHYFTNPIKGYLITSDQNKEKNAVKDAYNFLNKQIDIHYQRRIERAIEEHLESKKKVKTEKASENKDGDNEETKKSMEKNEESLQKKLEEELQGYQKDTRIFYNVETNCKCVIFIKINPLFQDIIDVKKVANIIIKDVRENKNPVSRLIPIEVACKADIDLFKEQITPMLQKKFNPETPKKWVLHYKCRNNNKFNMKQFLDIIIEVVGRNHSVDYKNPDYTIFVEINNQMMCLSILKKFVTYKGYSFNVDPPAHIQKKDGGNNKNEENKAGDDTQNKVSEESKPPQGSLVTQDLEFEEKGENDEEDKEEAKGKEEKDEEDKNSEESVDIF